MDVLSLQELPPKAHEWLESHFDLVVAPRLVDDPIALSEALRTVRAFIVPRRFPITATLMDAAPKLECIAHLAAGTENIDLYAAKAREVQIINPVSVVVRSDAEFMLAGLLLIARRGVVSQLLRPETARPAPMGRELFDSTVAMIGLAPIASVLAPMLKALGVRLVGYDAALGDNSPMWEKLGIEFMPLAQCLAVADSVMLHMLFAPRYEGLFGDRLLAHCKRGQNWVCITRSHVFDRAALAQAITDGRIATLVMDSPEIDFVDETSPLRGLSNLLVTPRLARRTEQAQQRAVWFVVHRITDILSRPSVTMPPP
jgi:phosphoglycerate dehydrogenase-like enzyme